MNKWVLMMLGFAFVIAVGVGVILVSDKSDEEVAADISLLSGVRLTQHGQQVCQKEIESATGQKVYSPSATAGDRVSTVTLTWEANDKKFKNIKCVYNLDRGITSLMIDDRTIIAK
ncbi:MAG: hypothetical protein ACU843_05990 [Gammaproteobacteria bacterium]